MNFRKVRGTRLYENVVNQIFELIADGHLRAGLRLPPERTLSEQFGVSRNVLREAFRALELRGILVSVPGGRRFIRHDNVGDSVDIRGLVLRLEHPTVLDILESRELVETQAVGLAVARITSADARALREAAARFETWEDNRSFHVALAEATHNIMLPKLVRLHLDLLQDLNQRGHYPPERAKQLLREHVGIAEAVIRKDVAKARALVRRHFLHTRRVMGLNGARRNGGAT